MTEPDKGTVKNTDTDGTRSSDSGSTDARAGDGSEITRRKLFERGAVTVGGLAGAAIGIPAIGFAIGPVNFSFIDISLGIDLVTP